MIHVTRCARQRLRRASRMVSALVSVSLPATVPAQARSADLPAELAPATRQTIARLADSLRGARLPADPIYAKAAEGVLKGADDARILIVVRRLARELGDARVALGPLADDAELVAGASALHVGAAPATLRRLSDAAVGGQIAGRGALATPLVVLADLLTRHVPPTVAAAAIDSLVARGAPAAEFAALRAAVERDIAAGRSPDAATVLRTRSVLDALDARARPPARGSPRPLPHDR